MNDPEGARQKVLERLQGLAEIEDAEDYVVPILIEAILMVESYRGARHQISFLPELGEQVDAMLRELSLTQRAAELARR
ncbi:hypothetical protein [Sphingomicrobium lutaoense]|uniref:Uncharacterized protein n=1 Tax=Sphingomicrobium lutaoense TaxID=515949 RepID=A0A839YY09_9SPHN|nr:hypothetical protein [Sphingomicrobium lutaoense]MBB3763198.1 hypothetical protein [Sphingomicrobium lutaoense]